MSTGFTLARNTIYLSLSTAFALCIALAFNIFLARTLGVERFGEYSFALSFVGLFGVLVEFSLDSVIVRDVARDPTTAGAYFSNALLLKGLLFLLALMLIVAASAVLGYPSQIRLLLYILSLGLLFDGVTKCCASLFSAAQRMQYPAALYLAERVLFALLGMVAVLLQGSVIAVVMCYIVAQAITQLASVILVHRQLEVKAKGIEYRFCKGLSQRAGSFFMISMIAAIYADIDKVLLFSMQDQMAVGLYAAAYRLVTIPVRFAGAFHQAVYPVLSKHAASPDQRLLTETYRRSVRYLMLAAVPLAIGTTLLGDQIIEAIYGHGYIRGAIAFKILIWAYALEFFNPFFSRILFAVGKQRTVLAAAILGAGSNILLNVMLIPYYSFVGAAIATLVSAALIFIALLAPVLRLFPSVSLAALTFKPALAGMIMLGVCSVLGNMPLIPLVILGGFVYCAGLLLVEAFPPEELSLFRRMLWDRVRLWTK